MDYNRIAIFTPNGRYYTMRVCDDKSLPDGKLERMRAYIVNPRDEDGFRVSLRVAQELTGKLNRREIRWDNLPARLDHDARR